MGVDFTPLHPRTPRSRHLGCAAKILAAPGTWNEGHRATILWFNRLSTDFHPTSAVVFGDPNAVAVLPESPAPRHQLRQVYVVQGNTILSSCSRRKRRWPWNRKPLQEHHKERLQCNALAKHGQWLSQVVHPSRALVSALGSCGQLVASHATFPFGRMRNSSIAARFCLAPCR